MNGHGNREVRRRAEQARRRLKVGPGVELTEVPPDEWPESVKPPPGLRRLLLGGRFLVFECASSCESVWHLMVSRIDGRPGITWDELFEVKSHAGYTNHEAVEVFPEAGRLVNSANMRHLWVFPLGIRMQFGLDAERTFRG